MASYDGEMMLTADGLALTTAEGVPVFRFARCIVPRGGPWAAGRVLALRVPLAGGAALANVADAKEAV